MAVSAAALWCSLFPATAHLQDVPRNPYTLPSTAYYDVEPWPAPFARPGYIRASNSGVFVESPDRIYLISRGEMKLPEHLPADFNGAIGSLPAPVLKQMKPELRDFSTGSCSKRGARREPLRARSRTSTASESMPTAFFTPRKRPAGARRSSRRNAASLLQSWLVFRRP